MIRGMDECTYVFVVHDFHEFELAIRSLCMCDVLEWAG